MANLDSAAKRAAGIAATGFLLVVLPVPDGSDADSILQRGHLATTYGSNTIEAVALDLTGIFRVVAGHEYDVVEGHEYRIIAGHEYRIVETR